MRYLLFSLATASAVLLTSCSYIKKETKVEAEIPAKGAEAPREILHKTFDWAPHSTTPAVRGVWITNVDSAVLMSRESIAEAMQALADANFNVVYPVVWNKGMTLYKSEVIKKYLGEDQPSPSRFETGDGARIREAHRKGIDPVYGDRDPLQELIEEAHARGLEVIPWFEFGFAASYNTGGGPILEKYPQWAAIDPEGNLVKKNNFEWMNAFDPEVRQFVTDLVMEVVQNYDIDGIQGDDRLPALPSLAGYDEATKARYRAETGKEPPTDIKEKAWVQWRADILTEYLAELRGLVKAVDPDLTISMSPSYYDWALYEYLQDSKTWTDRGLVDSIHPQAYRYDFPAYARIVDDLTKNQFSEDQLDLLYPGVLINLGTYTIDDDYFLDALAYNRMKGVNGEVFFFYEGLRRNGDRMLTLLKAGPYAEKAPLPYRVEAPRRAAPVVVNLSEGRFSTDWEPSPAGTEFMQNRGGAQSRLIMEATVPESGEYDIYMKLPKGDPTYSNSAYFVLPQIQVDLSVPKEQRPFIPMPTADVSSAMKVLSVDQSTIAQTQWVKIGSTPVRGGERFTAISLLANEQDSERVTVAGPVMLLRNHREER